MIAKLLIFFYLIFVPNILAEDISEIYDHAKDAVVLIVSYDENNVPLSMGTGFYYKDNLIATNYHIIRGALSFYVKNIGSNKRFEACKVKSYSEKWDIALIEVDKKIRPLPSLKDGKQKIGDKVVVIGNPRGLEGSVSAGIISGIRGMGGFEVYQITASVSPGSSGGPVLNMSGYIIGITSFSIYGSQNLNFAVPVSFIEKLAKKEMKWEPAKNADIKPKRDNAGIKMVLFKKLWNSGKESFSLKNTTQNTVKNIKAALLYKTMDGEVFNYRMVSLPDMLPPGFAKMKTDESFDQNSEFVYYKDTSSLSFNCEKFDVELRVLSYDIADDVM